MSIANSLSSVPTSPINRTPVTVRKEENVGDGERIISTVAGCGLVLRGLQHGSIKGLIVSLIGGSLIYRGATGYCECYHQLGFSSAMPHRPTGVRAEHGVKVEESVTVQAPAAELYDFWRNVENLPLIMSHLGSVRAVSDTLSHWTAKDPFDRILEWDVEIFNERAGELIAWRSLEGGGIDTAGTVRFEQLSHDRGTVLHVSLKYEPPGGTIEAMIAKLSGAGAAHAIREDMRHFKQMMETGEFPTTRFQSRGKARRN